MKKLLVSLAALCLPFFAVAADEYNSDEKNWIAAAQPFYKEAKAQGIDSLVGVILDADKGSSPVQMLFRKDEQKCIFVVAVRDNYASRVLQYNVITTGWGAEVARSAAIAHEYGHCLHNMALARNAPEAPLLPAINSPKSEAMADVFSLAWFARNRPDDFERALKFVRTMRTKLSRDDDLHDTYVYLKDLGDLPQRMAQQPATPFQYAMNIVLGAPLPQAVAQPVVTASALPGDVVAAAK